MRVDFIQPTELVSILNVTSVVCQEKDKFEWREGDGYQVYSSSSSEDSADVYFLLDTHNQNAFAHWVFENFVYISYFFQIKKDFPGVKIVLYEHKDYKYLFLEDCGIEKSDIILVKDVDFQYQTLNKDPIIHSLCKANRVFFHPYGSLNSQIVEAYHCNAMLAYQQQIRSLSSEKTIPILYLPRGEKENFHFLDRRYVIQGQCKELVRGLGGVIFETDINTDLQKQISLVRSAKVILCDYGSNLWVNGFFSEGAHIIFLNVGWVQEKNLPYYGILYSLIQKQNKSMHNIKAYKADENVRPSLVYHSFENVKDCIEHCVYTS